MSLYRELRKENSRCLRVKVEANIDPCASCVVKDCKSIYHCGKCPYNPFEKIERKTNNLDNLDSLVIMC